MAFSLIKDIISFFSQLCAGPISYIRELQENLKSLRTSIEELKDVRDDVRARVETQEANRMRRTHQVAGWLVRADPMEVEVEGILREGYEEIEDRFLGGFCPKNCYASYKLGEKVFRKIKDVDKLKGQGRSFELVAEPLPPPAVIEMPVAQATSMDRMLEEAWSCISNEQVGIIGIYGIGGVGKTTLLKRINNEFLRRRTIHFDVVIWVVVSKEGNEKKIQDDVAERLELKLSENESFDVRASKLHFELSKKRFVLFLDDVWEVVDLTAVGIPCPDLINKSKVVFTTRSEDACGQMKAREKIKVECLDSAEAWKLFQEEVGDEALNSHPEIPAIAKQVAEECGGLPLALITTGRAMAYKKTRQEWRHAVSILKNSASEFSGLKKNVYSTLKFSYESLEDDIIKSCFLYCSLFPEDYSIQIEQLIRYWIGEGFLDEFDDMDQVENKGYDIIGKLKQACLLESGFNSRTVKMHDVLRDLALWIGCDDGRKKNKLLVQAGVALAEAPKVEKWREAERISLMNNKLETLGEEAPKCPNLLTLILFRNSFLRNICNGFFQYMHVLRVLDLSSTGIEVLPTSIVELVELEYLGLARTKITKLPQEMKSLVKLKCLDLNLTRDLEFIPYGILSRFSRLQVLDFTKSKFEHWEAESGDIGQDEGNVGASMEELGCLRELQHLSIRITNVASLNIILGSEKLARCTRGLSITKCEQLTPAILKYRSLSNIRDVSIKNCKFKDLSWLCGAPNLEKLFVCGCEWLELICDGTAGCFPNLRVVVIYDCNALKDLSWLCGAPNLEELHVSSCECLELICDGTAGCFPNLRVVYIKDCNALKDLSWLCGAPNLEKLSVSGCECLELICDGTARCFPNLRVVYINGCNALKDLSWLCGAPNLEKLSVIVCECFELKCDGTAGCFPNLRVVVIYDCNALKDLSWLCGAPNLEELHVNSCECLELICDGTAGCFPNLLVVDIIGCNALKDLSCLCGAPNLKKLLVSNCKCLELICDRTAGCFPNLHEVDIYGCNALKDLSWLCGAPDLEKLSVRGCECLELICDGTTGCFPNFREVDIYGCNALKDLSWLCGAPDLEKLSVRDCECLELICDGTTGCFPNLREVDIEDCNALKDLSWLCGAPDLEKLSMRACECLELICDGTTRCFPNLREVDIYGCNALKDLSWLCGAPDLEKLSVRDCECLELIFDGTIGCFPNIREVVIYDCNALKDLSWLCGAPNLEKLHVSCCECPELICDRTAGCFPNLREVDIYGCNALKDLSWLCGAPNLEELSVSGWEWLELICDGTVGCSPNLREVDIEDCNALKDLSWLCGAPNLEKLSVSNCKCLELICDRTAGCFPNLREVDIYGCNALKDLSWLCGAPNLEKLVVRHCKCLELICDGEDAEVKESPLKFSHLSLLSLSDLPELKRIPWHAIPPGTRTIESCPKATPPNEPKHLESNEISRKRKMKFKVGEAGFWDASGKS